jgi:hypothetical protein
VIQDLNCELYCSARSLHCSAKSVLCFDLAPVEKVCPGMVPCVDILPLIAGDYVHMIAT